MAIWGGWVYGGYQNGLRLGYDQWYENGRVYVRLYAQTLYAVQDSSNTFTLSGSHSDSKAVSINHGSSGGTTTIGTYSRSVPQVYGSAQSGSWSASLSDVHVFGTATVGASWNVDALPYLAPRPPLNPAVTRISDSQQRVTWTTNYDSASGAQPWTHVEIHRRDDVNDFRLVASVSWSVTAWTDTTTEPNRNYTYHVHSVNSAGRASANAGTIPTSPARPGTPDIRVDGTLIRASWADNARTDTTYDVYVEQVSAAGTTSGAWTTGLPGTGAATGPMAWQMTKPTGVRSVRIKVRAWSGAAFSPESAWSNLILLEQPPFAPTVQQPDLVVVAGQPIPVAWAYNSADGSAQRQYQIRHRVQGTTTWTTRTAVTSTATSTTIPATAGTSGQSVEIQVRTLGAHTDWGAWSESRVTLISARPVGTLATPTLTAPSVTLSWTYSDSDGHPQNAYKVTVKQSGTVVHEMTGYGTATTYTTPAILDNGAAYTFELTVQDSTGLWSTVSTRSGTVTYPAPPTPTITAATWDAETGAVLLTYSTPVPGSGEQAATSLTVQRRISGEQWGTLVEDLPISGSVTDPIPPLVAGLEYRALTISALDTSSVGAPRVVDTSNSRGWAYLNGGPGFGRLIKVKDNTNMSINASRDKTLHKFAGRSGVVGYATPRTDSTPSLSFTSSPFSGEQSTPAEIEAFVREEAGVVCYRDGFGGRSRGIKRFVYITGVSYSYHGVTAEGSVSMEEASYIE